MSEVKFKLTEGTARQDYVDGKCVGQKFTCGDQCWWEDEVGEHIDFIDTEQYQPYDMVHPAIWGLLTDWGVVNDDDCSDAEFAAKVEKFRKQLER